MNNFYKYSQYYDLLYNDKDYKAESGYINNLIETYFPQAKSILELGSGSGSHAVYLSAFGHKISGIERSREMASISKQKNIKNFNVIEGDISNTKLSQKYDVAISLFHVISYLTDNNSLISCFQNTYNHLNNNGIFIFDVWYSPAVYYLKPETRIKRFENEEIKVTRISEPSIEFDKNIVEVNFESIIEDKISKNINVIKECHPMRHFSIPEMELIATMTSFDIIKVEEFLTGELPSEKTWGVCFVLRKK